MTYENFNDEPHLYNFSRGDGYIYFGTYPQTKVTDESLIEKLNSTLLNWESYDYYSGNGISKTANPGDWAEYADTTYNGTKYRAVRFSIYRPEITWDYPETENLLVPDNGYAVNTIYWFKFEPIKWRVLDQKSGFVMSELILDSQPYNNVVLESGANDWAKSFIRKWLNNEFYNIAFTTEEKMQF